VRSLPKICTGLHRIVDCEAAHSLIGQADVRRQFVELEKVRMRPSDGARFMRDAVIVGFGVEMKDQIVMEKT
jgi:hypothetical protein